MKSITLIIFLIMFFAKYETSFAEELTFRMLEELPSLNAKDFQEMQIPKEIMHYHASIVRIRGFLFRSNQGELILAAEPNLKTCCVGSRDKITRQIVIIGDLEKPMGYGNAVYLEGKFLVDPIKNQEGQWQKLYVLENASFISENRERNLVPLYIAVGIIGVGMFLFFLRTVTYKRVQK